MPEKYQKNGNRSARVVLGEAITPAQTAVLERDRELNLSFGRRDLGNFRVNVFWQRNSPAVVVRYIQSEIPSIVELGLPQVLTGQPLPLPGHANEQAHALWRPSDAATQRAHPGWAGLLADYRLQGLAVLALTGWMLVVFW